MNKTDKKARNSSANYFFTPKTIPQKSREHWPLKFLTSRFKTKSIYNLS